jgi:hypothetical protein
MLENGSEERGAGRRTGSESGERKQEEDLRFMAAPKIALLPWHDPVTPYRNPIRNIGK